MNASTAHEGRIAVPVSEPMVPTRWINTEPVESTDKPCAIDSLELEAHVSGLYAEVTETLVISNPNRRDLSVSVELPMPDRAAVCGYALDVDGQMVDGVVVPREKARVAFETEQRIGADPGLVEAVKGNVYRTRVYPVPGKEARKVQLRYIAPLLVSEGRCAVLDMPMPAETVGKRTVRVEVELLDCPSPEISGVDGSQFEECGTFWIAKSREENVASGSGVRVALPALPSSFALVERDEEGSLWFTASEIAPKRFSGDVPAVSTITVLWDVSGSRASVDHAAELELLRGYCEHDSFEAFRLITFSDTAEELEFGSAEKLLDHIGALTYDGGSDFKELSAVLAASPGEREDCVCVLFTDGMDTLSGEPVSFPAGSKVLAVASGPGRDVETLRQACGGLVFDLAAAPKGAEALMRAIFHPSMLAGVAGEGVADVIGIGSGADGRYSVVGRLVTDKTAITFENTGAKFALDTEGARRGSGISRAWAAMRVAQLSPRAGDNAEELLSLGRRFGVVSPATSLLVLETLDQWLRYDIEPPATWRRMHREWKRHRRGAMRVSSEQEMAEEHLRDLKREWAGLKEWWSRDYPVSKRRAQPSRGVEEGLPDGLRLGEHVMGRSYTAGDISGLVPADYMVEEGAVCASAPEPCNDGVSDDSAAATDATSVKVQAWMPDAEYLAALDKAVADGAEAARYAYFRQRREHAASPSFFIDCAGWFMANGDKAFGMRVLTNLVELRIEDAALLRVMAWRMREAGELERALATLTRVLKLRPEDSQSHRDMALILDELARKAFGEGDEAKARERAEEAGAFYRKIALTPWQRRAMSIALFAVEEYNVLRAWAGLQNWDAPPKLEPLDGELEGVLECDLRITLAWDADETDVDLHVTEPNGEEAYYGNRLTYEGGRVSEDITDGYGPELYEIRRAKDGTYDIRAHYFASHQQTVFGPASCTLTVYTDWGRPSQSQQVTSIRLEDENEMVAVGTATYGAQHEGGGPDDKEASGVDSRIVKGSTAADLIAEYGRPSWGDLNEASGKLTWDLPGGRSRVATIAEGKVDRIVEVMPWGEEMIVVQ